MKKKLTIEDIKKFVVESGSDNLQAFGGEFEGGIHCQQLPEEMAPCIHEILEHGNSINSYLEIGVAAGGTSFLVNHFFSPRMVLIDDNKHHKAGLRPTVLNGIDRVELIGRSDDEDIISGAFKYSPYDLIMIDGDHLYPGVKLDVVTYLPMLSIGGFLILHDSAMTQWGVTRVVRELKNDSSMDFMGEYISDAHPTPCGVALFRKAK
jgi:predicted O-methyltransferase YrrM